MDISIATVLTESALLMSEHGENEEYDRALVELCTYIAGGSSDDVEKTQGALVAIKNTNIDVSMVATALYNEYLS